MINVYEAKSYRVKGISFHPTNTWVLTTLHNGVVLIYDYRNGILLDKYEEHEGPVRSGDFHNSQPFFVTGGDDCKIKLWNYNTKRCVFNLLGHTDYIRTVQFHNELPWIISSSDDQTIRIWNWLNRTQLTTVTGHDHYVMSAFFHSSLDLIVSSSLDQTIRVWDYSTLRKKFFEARSRAYEVVSMDVTVKFKLDGHDRGVNWAVFHPSLMLIASGADDKNIKIWKFSDTNCTEADTLRGHFNNVSSVVFHPKLDILISNSEDKSLRIWDLAKKTCIDKVTKETDRFWIISSHPTLNIFACGSDNGLLVFKLESTRLPSVAIPGNRIIYYQNKELYLWKFDQTDKNMLFTSKFNCKTLRHGIKRIVYNHFNTSPNNFIFALVCDDSNNKSVYYYNLKMDNNNKVIGEEICLEAKSIVFISKEKGILLRSSSLVIFDSSNPSRSMTIFEIPGITNDIIEDIFQAPLGKFIIKLKNDVIGLIDANSKKIINELNEISELKIVVWNSNMTQSGLVGKNSIFLVSKNFEILNKMRENSSIKSCCFDENGILFYSTNFHIKYFLSENGLSGIIKSIKTTNYLMMVFASRLFYSDSQQQVKSDNFMYNDCKFNLALQNKNYDVIVNILKTSKIFGKKLVEKIKMAGFPDLSLNYVTDNREKFELALESEKLEEATLAADLLNDKVYYHKLAEKAMFIGKINIAEYCYLKSNDYDKLVFFYMLTGKRDKLQKLESIFQTKSDNSRRFLNTIYTGNITDRIKLLAETGKIPLALLTAKINRNHELENFILQNSNEILTKINPNQWEQIIRTANPLVPLKPILMRENKDYNSLWVSLHEYNKSKQTLENSSILNEIEKENEIVSQNIGGNINMIENCEKKVITEELQKDNKKSIGKNWKTDEEEDEELEIKSAIEPSQKKNIDIQLLITSDDDLIRKINESSLIPGVHFALGNFQKAINLLKTQINLANIDGIKHLLKNIYLSNNSQIKFIPCLQNNSSIIRSTTSGKMLPSSSVTITKILAIINKAYDLGTTEEALNLFREVFSMVLFFIASDKNEESKIKDIINICTEYCYLIRMNQIKEKVKSDKIQNAEISCLMTLCKLEQPIHYYFIYNKAKIACKNIKNYLSAVNFCKKILLLEKELSGSEEVDFDKIKSEFVNYQNLGTNAHQFSFNTTENIQNARGNIEALNFTLIRENKSIKCPLCSSSYFSDAVKRVCENCKLSIIGNEYLGLKISSDFN